MPGPSTREEFKEYCLRALGKPVIDINVDDDQVEDRITDAIQFFQEFHFDGAERAFLKYRLTQDDINNGYILLSSASTNSYYNAIGASGQNVSTEPYTEAGLSGSSKIEENILSVTKVFHFSSSSINMWDIRYQFMLNDLYTIGSIDIAHYTITQQYLSMLRELLAPEKAIRFTRKTNKLYIDTKWNTQFKPDDYLIVECHKAIDPSVYPEVYTDILLKKYCIALIKRQWGANLIKYAGMQLPGMTLFNGQQIFFDANLEIEKIENEVQSRWELPPQIMMG